MFNVQGSEIIIILVLALIVLGPERLPDAIRRFTKAYGEFKKMSNGFQSELRNALDEPMRELRDTADLVRKNTVDAPMKELRDTAELVRRSTDLRDLVVTDAPVAGAPPVKPKSAEMFDPMGKRARNAAAADAARAEDASTSTDPAVPTAAPTDGFGPPTTDPVAFLAPPAPGAVADAALPAPGAPEAPEERPSA